MAQSTKEQQAATAKTPADSSYMSERMVQDRCHRLFGEGHWKRLYEFCQREPRAADWTLGRIARVHLFDRRDGRVQELFARLADGRSPKSDLAPPPAAPDDIEEVSDADICASEEQPIAPLFSAPVTPPPTSTAAPVADRLLESFFKDRDDGLFVEAGRTLLAWLRALPAPAEEIPLMAVEFREVAAELARRGELKLLMGLCTALPSRICAGAMLDLSEKLRLGASLHEPALEYQAALRQKAVLGGSASRRLDQTFLDEVRRVLMGPEGPA